MQDTPKDDASKPEMENLLSTPLAATDNLEVVVSRVKVPVGVELPMHYHPGEEFAYVIDGTITIKFKDGEDTDYSAGSAGVVPCRAVHTDRETDPADTRLLQAVPGRMASAPVNHSA